MPLDDELLIDGELVVLTGETAMVLSEVATVALDQLSTAVWTSVEALAESLDAAVGLPPEGHAAVYALVRTLEDAGLVAVEPT